MIARWLAISIVLVAFGLGDLWLQLHKPDYKFRLTVEVDTPTGPVVGSSVIVVHRDKVLFGRNDGDMSIKGDAVFVDLGEGSTLSRCLHSADTLKSRTG